MRNKLSYGFFIVILLVLLLPLVGIYIFTHYMNNLVGDAPQPSEALNNLPEDSPFSGFKKLSPILNVLNYLPYLVPGLFFIIILSMLFLKLKSDWKGIGKSEEPEVENPTANFATKTFINGKEVTNETPIGEIIKEQMHKATDQGNAFSPTGKNSFIINGKEVSAEQLSQLFQGKLTDAQKEMLRNLGNQS